MGIADASTRALIQKISEASAGSAGVVTIQHLSLIERAGGFLLAVLRDIYVYVFPLLHMMLVVMIFLTLLLVLGRSLGLIGLLMWDRFHKKNPVAIDRMGVQPAVSILIPAYNEEENIAATVESVIRSSYPRREIIVIDDGSKDNTSAQVQSVIDAYPHDGVRLIRVENGGKAHALNVGLEHAKYDIIVVLDADAVLDKEALWHFTKHFTDEKVGAVAGKVRTTASSTLLDLFQTLEYAVGQNIDKRAFSTIGAVGVVPGPAGAWRRKSVLDLGGFSTETLVEDQDMTLTILRSGQKVIYEAEAIAYTETPHSVKNFLKQRFRWVYGTMQCFWKHKGAVGERRGGVMAFVVLPNIFIFNIVLPLAYPFADSAMLVGLFLGEWHTLILPFILFTAFDVIYAMWGVWKEPQAWRLILAVPLQRVVYRQLLYYSVMKGVVRAVEGTGSGWNKFNKMGETRRFFFTSMVVPVPSNISNAQAAAPEPESAPGMLALPERVTALKGEPSSPLQGAVSLSVIPDRFQSATEVPGPAWSPNLLGGAFEESGTFEKSTT
jgi:cellulose synthase/poly-beta-1,6-N-acetylglucosamine synthase-like glycosyltransferase